MRTVLHRRWPRSYRSAGEAPVTRYFYLGLSGNFKTLSRPFLPQGDEYGGELFYNLAITPWARFTFDLQIARPSTIGYDTVIIPGFRLQVLF